MLVAVLGLGFVAGCGGGTPAPPAATSTATSTPQPAAPGSGANAYIGSIAVDPADGTMILGTGLGLFRLEPGAKRAERVVGTLSAPEATGEVSSNLVVRFRGPGELLASGHPEGAGALPENLGLIRSRDAGETWEPISELGQSDHHVIQIAGDRLAVVEQDDAGLRISSDGGLTFQERTPPAAPIDVAFDPRDGARMIVSTKDQGLYTSTNEGQSWRPRDPAFDSQLAWPASDTLYRADPGGLIKVSADGGDTWTERGTVGRTVHDLAVDAKGSLYASGPGGEVWRSTDRGATWKQHLVLE